MKTGETYWNSKQKRRFDMAVVGPSQPLLFAARKALEHSTDDPTYTSLFVQRRIGMQHGQEHTFMIHKLSTLNPEGEPYSDLAKLFRKLGVDELAQLTNIWRGDMSVCGYRPVVPVGYEGATGFDEIMDHLPPQLGNRWSHMTRSRRPGIIGSFGLYQHTESPDPSEVFEIRAEMDLRDAAEDSLASNAALVGRFIALAAARRLQ
jgi:lipopolysaccharide/colanic/teichoic acid biosynthesis glycosyltransferase